MRWTTIGMLTVCGVALSACGGSSGKFVNDPRPPTPINVTVYIDNARVSVSPNSVGAGPVVFIITNQASKAESLSILPAGVSAGQSLANTGPINPQAATQITVDFSQPGDYSVSTAPGGSTDASLATSSTIQPGRLRIGRKRPSASNQLLQP